MVPRSHRPSPLLAAVALAAVACNGGSNSTNAAPRLTSVPLQSTTGDSAFSLDLASYVTDREGAALTYAVTGGGGSFAGSVYSHTFDTMGTYSVAFTVSDGAKSTAGTFAVKVTEANLAVVREDASGLLLMDSRTNALLRVASMSPTPAFQTGLGDGRLVYSLAGPAGNNLFVFDPLTRATVELAPGESAAVDYQTKTSDGRVLFTAGTSASSVLYIFNPRTGLSTPIAVGELPNVVVNTEDLVFFEVTNAGQTDVWLYDPENDDAQAVATDANAEHLVGALPNGGVVISRVGGGGEDDLLYFKRSIGLVEIGADVPAIASADKTFHASGTGSQVVFTATGSDRAVYAWNPSNGQTTNLSAAIAGTAFDLFAAIGAGNEVVFQRVVSGSEVDAYFYDLDSAVSGTVRDAADVSEVLGVSGDGTTNWVFVRPSGATSSLLAVSLVASPVTQTWAAGGAVDASVNTIANGDVVGRRTDGSALDLFDVSAGTWGTAITGIGLAFAGDGLDAGDFVYSLTSSSQTDLSMWDASALASVVLSDAAGNDVFQLRTDDHTILFTHVIVPDTNADLFVWDGATATRITGVDEVGGLHDHTVLGSYTGAR